MISTFCRVVLVRPRNPNNIGAAARAMKNFGFAELALVAPHAPVWEEARAAVGAADLLACARLSPTLAEAVVDCSFVVGTVGRGGTEAALTPEALREELTRRPARLALIFGPEKTGLTNADLSHCHRVLSIPTAPDCPSMNLAQAVAVCCYELARGVAAAPPTVPKAADAGEIEGLLGQAVKVLHGVGFLGPHNERLMTEEFRRALLRWRLTRRDAALLRGMLRQIGWKVELPDRGAESGEIF